jgi:hypothetical protein
MRTLRDLFRRLPPDGRLLHALRNFNLAPFRSGKAVSVKHLAEQLGLDVHQVDLPRGMAGRLVSDPFSDSGYAVEINRSHDVRSRRFTLLHEIGHFLLHIDRSDPLADPMLLSRSDEEFYFDQIKEREANDFADVLLFGDGALSAAFSLFDRDVEKTANYFGVTDRMIEVALSKFKVR